MKGSLQKRLGTGLIVSLVLLFGLQWLMVTSSIRSLTEGYVLSRLDRDAENLLAGLAPGSGDVPFALPPERIDPIYLRPFSGHYYRISADGRILRSRSLWDQDLPVPPEEAGRRATLRLPGPQGQKLLVRTGGFRKTGHEITIAVSEDLTPLEADMRTFQIRYGFISIGVLFILILIQYRIVRSGLFPLERARGDIALLEQGQIRKLREDVPADIRPFIGEINRLLEAMSDRIKRSRNALGNLAHALKGPLTLLIHLSERSELRDFPELRRDLIEQTAAVRALLDRELKRARLAGSGRPGTLFSMKEEITHLLEALKKIHSDKHPDLELHLPDAPVAAGDREDMVEMLGNLLDNAFKWAGHKIRIEVTGHEGIGITIEDDGPGCPSEALERLALRGVRIDESPAGSGLGLSIVKEIVDQYDGKIEFGRSERLGGFFVRVTLPPYRSPSAGSAPLSGGSPTASTLTLK